MFGSTLLAGAAASWLWFSTSPPVHELATTTQHANTAQHIDTTRLQENTLLSSGSIASSKSYSTSELPPLAEDNPLDFHDRVSQNETSATPATEGTEKLTAIPQSIKGIRTVQLSKSELEKIGIVEKNGTLTLAAELGFSSQNRAPLNAFAANQKNHQVNVVFNQSQLKDVIKSFGYDNDAEDQIMKFNVKIDTFSIESRLAPVADSLNTKIYPLIISHESVDESGVRASKVLLFGNTNADPEHEQYASEISSLLDLYITSTQPQRRDIIRFPILSKLIPVSIKLAKNESNGAEIILWYYPTDELIKALPPRYGDAIHVERNNIQKFEDKHGRDTTHSLLEVRFSGDYKYTDVESARKGSVEILSVGPNPASDHTTIRFKLYEQRSISVVLYSMNGSQVGVLQTLGGLHAGTNEVALDVRSLNSGVYLITLVSDKGEQAIQRFIIQN